MASFMRWLMPTEMVRRAGLTLTATSAPTPVDSPVVVAGMGCPGASVLYTLISKGIPQAASVYVIS